MEVDVVKPWYQNQSFKSQAMGSTFGAFGKKGEKGKGKEKWHPPQQQQKGGKGDTKGKKGVLDAGKGLTKGKTKNQYPTVGKGPMQTAPIFQGYCNH